MNLSEEDRLWRESIRPSNNEAHLDIEKEIQKKKNGTFTCIIRCNAGNIVDIVLMEYVKGSELFKTSSIYITELSVTHGIGGTNNQDGIWPNYFNSSIDERSAKPSYAQFGKTEKKEI